MVPAEYDKRMAMAQVHIKYAMQLSMEQVTAGRYFGFEHPSGASSGSLPTVLRVAIMPGVERIQFDMCCFGMTAPKSKSLVRKRTTIMTNHAGVKAAVRGKLCNRQHSHFRIQGSNGGVQVSTWCQVYPKRLATAIVQALVST